MGASRDNFVKYPRTPHLSGSRGTADDRHWGRRETEAFLKDPSLIIEEKLDGTNVGIHFTTVGRMILQCRGHEITEGMHPQYDLFKQWASVKRGTLEEMLGSRYILYGEWLYAKHSIHYRSLPHYFFEFDVWDKDEARFLTLADRLALLSGRGLQTVPVLHQGAIPLDDLAPLIGASAYDSQFDNPTTGRPDTLMEGLYLRTESEDRVTARAKLVRPEFVEKVKQSEHWQQQAMVPNLLVEGAELWA